MGYLSLDSRCSTYVNSIDSSPRCWRRNWKTPSLPASAASFNRSRLTSDVNVSIRSYPEKKKGRKDEALLASGRKGWTNLFGLDELESLVGVAEPGMLQCLLLVELALDLIPLVPKAGEVQLPFPQLGP